jgi:hypothetical protein
VNKPIITLNSINKSLFAMERYCVIFEVRTEFLNIIQMSFVIQSVKHGDGFIPLTF